MQQLQAGFYGYCSLADRAQRATGSEAVVLSARYEDFAHRAASLDHARAIEALRVPGDHRVEAVYPKRPRFRSDHASLKVLSYEGSFPPP